MRRVALLGLAALLLAGCGGGGENETTTDGFTLGSPTTTAAPEATDPGKDAIEAFVAAAHAARPAAIWRLLSTETKRRVGPFARFREHTATELAEGVGSFRGFKVIVSERITPEFGVVAIDGSRVAEGTPERDVYAVALRLEGSAWKVELFGPVQVRAIGPDPGAREQVVAQIAAAVSGAGGSGTAVLYLDGQAENPKVYGTASNSTVVANFDPALDPGRHTVVVFGSVGRDASATGWWFRVARKPKAR
jgi:hypothetical protein